MTNYNQVDDEVLLKEILPLPSEKIITGRFSADSEAQAGTCSGRCDTGTCRAFV